ncbi:DUF2809 domain-containing protein [Hymenobacter tibetensis]|uniref:DUF2809 domain-containing protein n=1 Tax=Hymenobacter tibetensis TaxID=497967 RepID=A0ABY4CXW8_9BACT|nr:DUF2809 domain-containing protein [Hymenobacter tibetensis]UOG74364.1 DUF2809 domain-containing protein [Hymenobacter tibetensis]
MASSLQKARSRIPEAAQQHRRNRILYGVLVCCTVLLGLGSRRFAVMLPAPVAAYSGDTLWALLVFWLLGFALPSLSSRRVAGAAWLFAVAIEVSQLYQAPWLNALRSTTIGALVLGHGFLWSDLLCYSTGILVGLACELLWLQKRSSLPPT